MAAAARHRCRSPAAGATRAHTRLANNMTKDAARAIDSAVCRSSAVCNQVVLRHRAEYCFQKRFKVLTLDRGARRHHPSAEAIAFNPPSSRCDFTKEPCVLDEAAAKIDGRGTRSPSAVPMPTV